MWTKWCVTFVLFAFLVTQICKTEAAITSVNKETRLRTFIYSSRTKNIWDNITRYILSIPRRYWQGKKSNIFNRVQEKFSGRKKSKLHNNRIDLEGVIGRHPQIFSKPTNIFNLMLRLFHEKRTSNYSPKQYPKSLSNTVHTGTSCEDLEELRDFFIQSYDRQADFIRQGVFSEIVAQLYNDAIESVVTTTGIVPLSLGLVDETSKDAHFDVANEYAILDIDTFLSTDQQNDEKSRIFPDFIPYELLPVRTVEESTLIEANRNASWENICNVINASIASESLEWQSDTISFPSDDEIRNMNDPEAYCAVMDERPIYGQELNAWTYTALVIGIVKQILLAGPDENTAQMILESHTSHVYNTAMCLGESGENLKILTNRLESYLSQVRTVLDIAPTGAAVRSLLPDVSTVDVAAWRKVIRSSEELYETEIGFLTSKASSGKACWPKWDGTTLECENLAGILKDKGTIEEVAERSTFGSVAASCNQEFQPVYRLEQNIKDIENCCASSCIRPVKDTPSHIVVNEMCCTACNSSEEVCDKQAEAGVISLWTWLSIVNR